MKRINNILSAFRKIFLGALAVLQGHVAVFLGLFDLRGRRCKWIWRPHQGFQQVLQIIPKSTQMNYKQNLESNLNS